ncbi:MAG: integration host factor subunit beta [Buchnera aphidicola (Pentalonia nigronervosa)]|uniref:Integration host factor subunit beta n=1 Tax=Buchnera aphidicola (Pentalonia nigronervosa) TaxID=1309793 RepID=A0A7H1AZU0_9GAMM|nr:MAG: integration host factor subunit beta [Buchnera aphidicola (Pentalonia nigronervosa)]
MTKLELFEKLSERRIPISDQNIKHAIKEILEYMTISLVQKRKIEIRGFGSFSLHYRSSRFGRNPKTGNKIQLNSKYVPYFKPGKKLRDRININK